MKDERPRATDHVAYGPRESECDYYLHVCFDSFLHILGEEIARGLNNADCFSRICEQEKNGVHAVCSCEPDGTWTVRAMVDSPLILRYSRANALKFVEAMKARNVPYTSGSREGNSHSDTGLGYKAFPEDLAAVPIPFVPEKRFAKLEVGKRAQKEVERLFDSLGGRWREATKEEQRRGYDYLFIPASGGHAERVEVKSRSEKKRFGTIFVQDMERNYDRRFT